MERCKYFGECGGCSIQDLSIEEQLKRKESHARKMLENYNPGNIHPIISSPESFRYRNKVEFVFGKKDGKVILGLHRRGSFYKIVGIDDCLLLSSVGNKILNDICEWANDASLTPYDPKKHKGFLRYTVLREGKNTGEIMVNLITAPSDDKIQVEKIKFLAKEITKNFPQVKSFLWSVSSRVADVAIGETEQVLHGSNYIYEKLSKFKFRISPYSFFQPNTKSAEILYDIITKQINLEGTMLDLYCGIGVISIYISPLAEKVISVDIDGESIEDAKENIVINNVSNCEFIKDSVENFLEILLFSQFHVKLSVIVVDPPRSGLHKKAKIGIIKMNPNIIIYVSCNIKALIQDLQDLTRLYKITNIYLIDMFPHTEHLEIVAKLEQK